MTLIKLNGEWVEVQSKDASALPKTETIPATAEVGTVLLYIGETTAIYITGHVYQYQQTSLEPVSYGWVDISMSDVQPLFQVDLNGADPSSYSAGKIYQALTNGTTLDGVTVTKGHFYTAQENESSGDWEWAEVSLSDTLETDPEPTKGSEDFVNSGDLYESISKVDEELCEQNNSIPTNYSVSAFTEFNGKLYAGTTAHGIYVSENGSTFTQNTSFPTNYTVYAFTEFNGKLYAGIRGTSSHGIYVSENGSTFTKNTSFPTNCSPYAFTKFNGKLYVGTDSHGIYVSEDGSTFTQNTSTPTSYTVSAFTEFNGKLYASTYGYGIYVSEDGSTFTQNTSFPTDYSVYKLTKFNGKLYVGTGSHGIYVSEDGSTFTQNTSFSTNHSVRALTEFNGKLYAGANDYFYGIYVSEDGSTFTQDTSFPTNYSVRALTELNGKLYVGTDSHGIYTMSIESSALVQKLDERYMSKGAVAVDQTYDAASTNAQSGTAVAEAVAVKVDKVSGKGLSTNDFTNEYKARLDDLDIKEKALALTALSGPKILTYKPNVSYSDKNVWNGSGILGLSQTDLTATFELKNGQIIISSVSVARHGSMPAVGSAAGGVCLYFRRSEILAELRDNLSTDEEKAIFDEMFSTVAPTNSPMILTDGNSIFHGEPGAELLAIPQTQYSMAHKSGDIINDCLYYNCGYVLAIVTSGTYAGSTETIPEIVAYKSKYAD